MPEGDRTWTWTISQAQMRELWARKTLHLFSHGIEVQLSLGTGDAPAATLQVTVAKPTPQEDVPNALTRKGSPRPSG